MSDDQVLPVTDDPDTGPFFSAVSSGELRVCVCTACGRAVHLPMQHCRHCGSADTAWVPAAPTGRLHSFTVVEHQVHPAFPVPYTLVLVSLDDHPDVRLVGHIAGRNELCIGQAMTAHFATDLGSPVLQWRPDSSPGGS